MAKLLKQSFKSCIHKILKRIFKLPGYGVQRISYVLRNLDSLSLLLWCYLMLWNLYSMLWIGEPIAVTCQNVDFVRVDCALKYRALLHESEQNVRDVRGIKVEPNVFTVDSVTTTIYSISLQAQNGDRLIEGYFDPNDPEIKTLQYRLNQFIEHPEKHITVLLK